MSRPVVGVRDSCPYPRHIEFPWPHPRCIICKKTDIELTRSHLVPHSLGGFVWARTHCKACNETLGYEVEAEVKNDDAIRLAVEHALVDQLPALADSFSKGQRYVRKTDHGVITAKKIDGDYRIGSTQSDDGILTQPEDVARKTAETMLRRQGASPTEIEEALERFDTTPFGDSFVPIGTGVSIRKGKVDEWQLPFDGSPTSPLFPAAIAFHFLALGLGAHVYDSSLDAVRESIDQRVLDPRHVRVEQLRGTHGYQPFHLVGLSQTEPHIVLRVQLFGNLIWRVHLPLLTARGQMSVGWELNLTTLGIDVVQRPDSIEIPLPPA